MDQHTRLPWPSLFPGVCSKSCPLSQWCHPTISASVIPFSSCLQSFPALGSFPLRRLFPWGDQSIGASASASVLPMNVQGWLIWYPCSPSTIDESINSLALSLLYGPTLTSVHNYWKTIALTIQTFLGQVMSLLFNMLSRFVITFLPRLPKLDLMPFLFTPIAPFTIPLIVLITLDCTGLFMVWFTMVVSASITDSGTVAQWRLLNEQMKENSFLWSLPHLSQSGQTVLSMFYSTFLQTSILGCLML